MPTQRPFLANFLAAFRAHSQPLPSSISASTTTSTTTATIWTAATASTISKPTTTTQTSSTPTTDAAAAAISSPRPINPKTHASQPPQTQALQHTVSPATHLPRSTPSPGLSTSASHTPVYGPPNKPSPTYPAYPTCQEVSSHARRASRMRRGSDSSLDSTGYRETGGARGRNGSGMVGAGGEKWFIGGRTAGGEERYYKLGLVQRERSADRISADRLSL